MKKTPVVVATGFTSAYLGDERSLREFVVGDFVTNKIIEEGENAVLYLINDSYDPLNERQLRVAVNKDPKLFQQFEKYCGQPIAEIPDPFGCHASLADHFVDALVQRLRSLGIHPVVLDAYKAYKAGHYAEYIKTTFENYERIHSLLAGKFDSYSMKNLFRAQCPECNCLDATHINQVDSKSINFRCERCGATSIQTYDEIKGKLSWKLDCAARWNIYGIDKEIFSKAHIEDLGSLAISSLISKTYFSGKVPEPIKYGSVSIDAELSYRLLEILPPEMLKKLFTDHVARDISLTKESVEHFCRKYMIAPDLSYVDFVNQDLPQIAIRDLKLGSLVSDERDVVTGSLIDYANRYSGFYYHKEYDISLSDAKNIDDTDKETAKKAQEFISYALSVRNNEADEEEIKALITKYLQNHKNKSKVFPCLRKVFGQQGGPVISTLLATLPYDYLNLIRMALGYHSEEFSETADSNEQENENKLEINIGT